MERLLVKKRAAADARVHLSLSYCKIGQLFIRKILELTICRRDCRLKCKRQDIRDLLLFNLGV